MEKIVNCPYIAQPDQRTCWHASYRMMLRWYGWPDSMADSLPNANEMRDRGIMDSEFHTCRDYIGLSSTRYTHFQKFENLTDMLDRYGPIWVSGFYADGHKHVVVVRGAREGWISDPEVYVNDPYRGITGAEARPAWWSYSRFQKRINPVQFACQHWP